MFDMSDITPVPNALTSDYLDKVMSSESPVQAMTEVATTLSSRLVMANGRLETMTNAMRGRNRELESLREYLKQLIEDDEITDKDIIDTLIKEHGVEVSETLTVVISVDVTVEVTVPRGTEPEMYEFEVDGVTYQGDTVDVKDMEVQSIEIND
jgi:predicted transcriptional regulator